MRPLWIRELRLYRAAPPRATVSTAWAHDPAPPHVRSRFRSLTEPERFAEYSVRAHGGVLATEPPRLAGDDHTLAVVREFRRVPLDASSLALMLFVAQPGRAARLIATLAHWAEEALSAFQPAYMLLARSLEQPCVSALLAGVHERRALQWARPSPFSVSLVLPEVTPLLAAPPERYAYCPDTAPAALSRTISPYAV
ncbi:MAG: hypothetical protein ACREM3_11350 [Candidatus Rokuibacteriota bacterium]